MSAQLAPTPHSQLHGSCTSWMNTTMSAGHDALWRPEVNGGDFHGVIHGLIGASASHLGVNGFDGDGMATLPGTAVARPVGHGHPHRAYPICVVKAHVMDRPEGRPDGPGNGAVREATGR